MHPLLEVTLGHLPVRDEKPKRRAELPELLGRLVDRLHAVVEVEGLTAARVLALERGPDELLVVLADRRANRTPARGRRLDDRDVTQPGERHVQSARDRRRREREHVDLEPQRADELLLRDAEALLLVEDHEAELLRDHVAREDPVRSDENLHLALAELVEDPRLVGARAEAGDHLDAHGKVAVALAEGVPVLLGEDRRRAEHEGLLPVQSGRERRAHCDLRLAEADVAADEPVHRPRRLEILLDGFDRPHLVVGLPIGEGRLQALEPVLAQVERDPGSLLAAGVEREELPGKLADGRPRPALQVLPGLAAELRQRGGARVRADVAADLGKLLVRDVQAVLAA